jgi:hypothetical protein
MSMILKCQNRFGVNNTDIRKFSGPRFRDKVENQRINVDIPH